MVGPEKAFDILHVLQDVDSFSGCRANGMQGATHKTVTKRKTLYAKSRQALHENVRELPEKWLAVKYIDEFVTCCFTERGCKD